LPPSTRSSTLFGASWRLSRRRHLPDEPVIAADLELGGELDGVELVLERAGLTSSERLVQRSLLAGDDAAAIAEYLASTPQTVVLLLSNARARLRDPPWVEPRRLRGTSGLVR
jgi:hypothetical protein